MIKCSIGRFRAEKMPVWRQSTVRLDLLVLAAIGPKVIGTYRGSQARKTTGHVCDGPRGMGLLQRIVRSNSRNKLTATLFHNIAYYVVISL